MQLGSIHKQFICKMPVNQTWEDILIIFYDHIVFILSMQSWLNTHTHTHTQISHVHTQNTIGKAINIDL